MDNDKLCKEGVSAKVANIMNNTSVDLTQSIHREGNHSSRKNINIGNKENKPHLPQPNSSRKNTAQKHTSYAEIFDKKSTMNMLINNQRSKGITGNGASRQLNSIKKEINSLKSMESPKNNYEFGYGQFSTNLDSFVSTNLDSFVNGFVIENV